MPNAYPPSPLALRKARAARWCLVWIISVVVICGGWRLKMHQLTRTRQQLADLERTVQPVREAESQLAALQARWKALTQREALISQLESPTGPAQWLGLIGRACGDEIALEEFHIDFGAAPQIHAKGISRDATAAQRFVHTLHSAEGVAAVELKSMQPAPRVAAGAREFTAEGRLQ